MTTSTLNLINIHKKQMLKPKVKEIADYSYRAQGEELSIPAELESWRIEEFEDILLSHEIMEMSEFETSMGYSDSVDQTYGLFD